MEGFAKCKFAESCGHEICIPEFCDEYEGVKMTIGDKIRGMSDDELVEKSLLVLSVYADVVGLKLSPKRLAAFKQCLLKEIQKPAEGGV